MKIEAQILLYLMVELAIPQFTSSRRLSKTPCEVRGTALVEQFFNVIFAEFQHSPPTCTCVQMCPDQPTYCYPNGCFKKAEKKKDTSPVSSIQQDAKTVFLVDNERDVFSDLMGNVNLMASPAGNPEKTYQRPWKSSLVGHINPFKDIVFKYKRLPKLEMKYNLREQIKHTRDKKAEVDLSKTRWPTNKQINRQANHHRTSNYLTSSFSETNQQEPPKYFKRYLTKRENQIGYDISALYLYKDASNFSLETLIDNLIERGLEANNTSTFKVSNSSKLKDDENNDAKLMNSILNDTEDIATKTSLVANEKKNNVHKDNSNHINSSTAAYFEMITTLSKQIEKRNNVSLEVIGNLTGNKFNVYSGDKSFDLFNNSTNNPTGSFKTGSNVSEEIKSTTNTIPTNLPFIPVINSQFKKNKQRIVRKLRNRKLN